MIDSEVICRKTLRGKKAKNKDFALEVAKLSRGNSLQGISSMTDIEIAKVLNFKHYTSIQQFKVLATHLGYFDDLDKPKVSRSTYQLQKDIDEFINKNQSIQQWVNNMRKRATGGKKFGGTTNLLRVFKNICDTLKMNPDQFIYGSSRQEILDHGEECLDNFMDIYMQGKASVQYRKSWNPKYVQRNTTVYSYAQAMRDFMRIHGYAYPTGQGGSVSQSITSFHGKYADVRFTDWNQYRTGKDYIKNNWGLDSDTFRWYSAGVEALPRAGAIFSMKNDFQPVTIGDNEFYVMQVYESKTSQYRGGIWEKYIVDADTKKSIDLVKKRGDFVIEDRDRKNVSKVIYPNLKQTYKFLGLDTIKPLIPELPETGFFLKHASHSLRHCGAQLWLTKTNWNVAFVASMGWKKAQELIDSYGQMPAEMKLKTLKDLKF